MGASYFFKNLKTDVCMVTSKKSILRCAHHYLDFFNFTMRASLFSKTSKIMMRIWSFFPIYLTKTIYAP